MFVQIFEYCNHCCELLREFLSMHVDPSGFGLSGSFGILDGLPVLYCLKSETCRMTSNDGRSLLSQCKMVGSATSELCTWSPPRICHSHVNSNKIHQSLASIGPMPTAQEGRSMPQAGDQLNLT